MQIDTTDTVIIQPGAHFRKIQWQTNKSISGDRVTIYGVYNFDGDGEPNNTKYEGEVKDGVPHGRGTWSHLSSDWIPKQNSGYSSDTWVRGQLFGCALRLPGDGDEVMVRIYPTPGCVDDKKLGEKIRKAVDPVPTWVKAEQAKYQGLFAGY